MSPPLILVAWMCTHLVSRVELAKPVLYRRSFKYYTANRLIAACLM